MAYSNQTIASLRAFTTPLTIMYPILRTRTKANLIV